MEIGFNAPSVGPLAEPEALFKICVDGEAMGFDFATFSDQVVIPAIISARYPYAETGGYRRRPPRSQRSRHLAHRFRIHRHLGGGNDRYDEAVPR